MDDDKTIIPTTEKKLFTNDTTGEDKVLIKIYEGERKLTKDNYQIELLNMNGTTLQTLNVPRTGLMFSCVLSCSCIARWPTAMV